MNRSDRSTAITLLALTIALGGVASAQPGPPPQPPPMDTGTYSDPAPPDPDPQPPPPPQPQPQPVLYAQPAPPPTSNDPVRPEGVSIALGAGYGLPTSLQTPNVTSLRLRLPSGIQIEPAVRITNVTSNAETPLDETTDKITEFGLSAIVRFPVVSRSKVDLELLGTAGFRNRKENPDGDYNTITSNVFAVGYGVAVAYWFSRHWNLSFNVTNPIVAYGSARRQLGAPGSSREEDVTQIGLVFEPDVFVMLHLYN
jgi:hypothetical protein